MELAGFGRVDRLGTPAQRRNASERERRTDARAPRFLGGPRVAIDQRYISDEPSARSQGTRAARAGRKCGRPGIAHSSGAIANQRPPMLTTAYGPGDCFIRGRGLFHP
jgi:hypothetical protein